MAVTAMNEAYINALLADASYVNLGRDINTRLAERLTQPLANFITKNFEVINQTGDDEIKGSANLICLKFQFAHISFKANNIYAMCLLYSLLNIAI
jgi:hypothetical protein